MVQSGVVGQVYRDFVGCGGILSGIPRSSLTSCKISRAVDLSKEPKC